MSERDRAAVDVNARRVHFKHFHDRKSLRGKSFVKLDNVDLVERQTG